MHELLQQIKSCTACASFLPEGTNPVMAASTKSKVLLIGQAPGRKVHTTGIPWNDQSGITLRQWMGVSPEIFYNAEKIAIMSMGFCYPGKGISGDRPPSSECAPRWHRSLLEKMPSVELTLLVGQYAQQYYLGKNVLVSLTETVRCFETYLPAYFPLPHPSPRNRLWLRRNEWFSKEVLPVLQEKIKRIV